MAENSKIEWTHHTFNPWWGCIKVSPECDNCYADRDAIRYGWSEAGKHFRIWGQGSPRRGFGRDHWEKPLLWNQKAKAAGERHRVFCASYGDVFEYWSRGEFPGVIDLNTERSKLWPIIRDTQNLDWMLLTKRPNNIVNMVPAEWLKNPPSNVWHGTSIGVKKSLWRLDELRKVPAVIRFLSCEPLLEDLGELDLDGIHLVIVGGESGPGARPMHPDWARSLRDQCQTAGVPFFFKQWGEWLDLSQLRGGPGWTRTRITDGKMYGRVSNGGFDGPENVLFGGRELETRYPWDDNTYPCMIRVGKHDAGRLLDGREWSEFPR